MRLKGFSFFVFVFASLNVFAQFQLSGLVRSQDDSVAVGDCMVYLNDGGKNTVTDARGRFVFTDLANGTYEVHVTSSGFEYTVVKVTITDRNQNVSIAVAPRVQELEVVTVTEVKNQFGFTRLRGVENMGIYEGKKSEVIIPEQLVANVATNNARQLYSRVAGLNIWENDGAGIQLSIAGRGLDPNRTSNFNTRQNGYDISADALGYPESYYTPPAEGVGRIEIVRGAASLQYGTQFGGLINFAMKKPVTDQKLELVARQTVGSFGFYNAFTSASGTVNKVGYYTFFQYKRGDGWRPNSGFDNKTFYAHVDYALTSNTKLGIDVTHMDYLAQQPGGLTDDMFEKNPRQSNRARNWFKVNWNLVALHLDHRINQRTEFNLRVFGLSAYRYSLGFRQNRVAIVDDNSERDLIKGDFTNWGAEARFLKRYDFLSKPSVLLMGARYYSGYNHSQQGVGSMSSDADFSFVNESEWITYDYRFPNKNVSFFVEHIINVSDRFSITPGLRFEHINTIARGYYGNISRDLAGNIIQISRTDERRGNGREFVIAGVGVSYKPGNHLDIYSNLSQNYRSITFSDMRISNPSSDIDPNLKDETGYSFDAGIRSEASAFYNFDVSLFYLNYDNRIGEISSYDASNMIKRIRTNIGRAVISGIEAYGELDVVGFLNKDYTPWSTVFFQNFAFIQSSYRDSKAPGVKGKAVEFVPAINMKSGVRLGYKEFKTSVQYTFVSDQFTEATNSSGKEPSAVTGLIPAYAVLDFSTSYQFQKFRIEASVNNFTDQMYFTRRATGYPGPGIIPSDGRSYFVTLQVKF